MRRYLLVGACMVALGASPPLAVGGVAHHLSAGVLNPTLLWATVDECSTSSSADVVGIRGSMPGTGNPHVQMFMWFRLQYRDSAGVWRYIGASGDSGFTNVGSGRYRSREAGTNFQLAANTASGTQLRGVVLFDWKLGKRLIHHIQLDTTAGHFVSQGADPTDYSAAFCAIS